VDTDGFEISYCIVLKQTVGIIIKANSMWNNGHTFQRMEEDLQNSMWNKSRIIIKANIRDQTIMDCDWSNDSSFMIVESINCGAPNIF
jgi:hypothetical protein